MFGHMRRFAVHIVGLWLILGGLAFGLVSPQTTHAAARRLDTGATVAKQGDGSDDPFGDAGNRTKALSWVKGMKFWMYVAMALGALGWIISFSTQVWAPMWYGQHKGFIYGFLPLLFVAGMIFNYIIKQAEAAQSVTVVLPHLATIIVRH